MTKSAAEELLDWLENNGDPAVALSYTPEAGFAVSLAKLP
jgi:hypothetical protein